VLDPEFVTTSMEEEGGYDFVEAAVEDAAVGAAPSGQRDPSTPANSSPTPSQRSTSPPRPTPTSTGLTPISTASGRR